jgi:hypothetical protein
MAKPQRIGLRWIRAFAMASVIVGPLAGFVAIGFAIHTSYFVSHAARTTGTITALTDKVDKDQGVNYAPTFIFATESGQLIKSQSAVASNPPSFSVGQQVPILFDPQNPSSAEINTTMQLWFVSIVCGIICVFFTPLGVIALRQPSIRNAPSFFRTN